ncbi:hypothetical protein ACI798_03330 [Geodermatophilus sp. SYSU D01045]
MTTPSGFAPDGMTEEGGRRLAGIPATVVLRAVQNRDFALALLHEDTRRPALDDPTLGLTDEQRTELSARLDEMAQLSFAEALGQLREEGFPFL